MGTQVGMLGLEGAIKRGYPRNHSATLAAIKAATEQVASPREGATGALLLDEFGDRIMDMELVNLAAPHTWQRVGTTRGAVDGLELYAHTPIVWAGGSISTPSDREEHHVSLEALYARPWQPQSLCFLEVDLLYS